MNANLVKAQNMKGGSRGLVLSLLGGLTIVLSGTLLGMVGWGSYGFAAAMFLLVFSAIPQLAFGILVLICAVARRRLVVIASSVTSLLWFLFFALVYADWASYLLVCVVGMVGGVLGILGSLLSEK